MTREFSTAQLSEAMEPGMSDQLEKLLRDLRITEVQAAHIAQLFGDRGYLRPEHLWRELLEQELPEADLRLVAAFMSGYMAGEAHNSPFEQFAVRSRSVIGLHDMGKIVLPALMAVLTLIGLKGVTKVPHRGTRDGIIIDALPEPRMPWDRDNSDNV